jgi:hypothetical protein
MPDFSLPSIPDKFKRTPEFRLLAACSWIAPPALEQDQAEKIVSLCRGVTDWDAFIGLVRRHGVPALAYTMLSRHGGDLVPGATREILKAGHVQSVGQSLFQAAELVRLIKMFASKGIDLIPLKGVFLSYQLYGDIGMRTSGDLDILVKPEQVDLAEQILEAEGFHCDFQVLKLTERQKQHVRVNIHHFDFTHSKSGLHVELHWNLGLWLIPGQLQTLLSQATRLKWQGISVKCLDDDATLLLLCDHGARHEWFSLKWLGDVVRLFSTEHSTSWDTLIDLAAEVDLQRTLAHSALLVHWIYDVTLPHELCTLIRQERLAVSLSERALKALQMSGGELARIGNRGQKMRDAMSMMRLRPSIPYRLILKFCLIPADDFQVLNLPTFLFWLYYPLRPILWIWRHFIRPRNSPKKQ